MKRDERDLQVFVDEKIYLNETMNMNGDLVAEVLYLGGLPQGNARFKRSKNRQKRQTGETAIISNVSTVVSGTSFKGTLQDIRVSTV